MTMNLKIVESLIEHRFKDLSLLQRALTHRSMSPDNNSYERLEFLGDRVLGLVLSQWLYARFSSADQGELTKRFHALARQEMLASICVDLGLHEHIHHEAGDLSSRPSVQADIMEAIIAALYLDGGLQAAQAFIKEHWSVETSTPDNFYENPKSTLQEWTARQGLPLPEYLLVSRSGQDHAPEFLVELHVKGFASVTGQASSIKTAERQAAIIFLEKEVGMPEENS